MKSWADHCSSDEESDDEIRNTHPAASSPGKLHPSLPGGDDDESSVEEELPPNGVAPPVPEKRHYDDLPTHPPYTAFIKNLSYEIRDNDQLVYELQGLLDRRYGGTDVKVQVMSAKLAVDKGGNRKGFGYVQFHTLQELVAFLNCDDGNSEILGRNLHIMVANNKRNDNRREKRQSHSGPPSRRNENTEIDGSKFRGGRYARNNSGKGKDTMNHAGGSGDGNTESSSQQPTRQRPSLKLAPRTKPLQDGQKAGGSSSSIFGDAKPRDENRWSSTRRSVNFVEESNEMSTSKDAAAVEDHTKAEDASSTASSKDVGMNGDEKDGSEVSEGRRPSSSSIGSKGSNGHSERHDRNHHGGRGRGKGRGGGNSHDKNSSSSLGSSGRGGGGGGGRGRGRGKWDGSRRDSSGRGGGRGGGGHDRKSTSGRGGSSNGDAKKRGSATTGEPPKALQPQPVVKESKPKTEVSNAFAALNFDDSDSD